jgi:hypothetical protein
MSDDELGFTKFGGDFYPGSPGGDIVHLATEDRGYGERTLCGKQSHPRLPHAMVTVKDQYCRPLGTPLRGPRTVGYTLVCERVSCPECKKRMREQGVYDAP